MATVHVIGGGLAGLAAAVRLAEAGVQVQLYEAAPQAGGRCRSYHDPALDMEIDNGNHLLLSGNHAALAYLRAIGAEDRLVGPAQAEFPFVDLANGERWLLRINDGPLPWWILSAGRRVPGTRAIDYVRLVRLLAPPRAMTVCETVPCNGAVYQRLLRPLLLAALNIEPREGSAALAGAVMRATLAAGGQACRPLVARGGLGNAFIEPALQFLRRRGTATHFNWRLRALAFNAEQVEALDFGDEKIAIGDGDRVILAVPPVVAAALVPDLLTPTESRAIVNAHFRLRPPAGAPLLLGVINGTVEWIFTFADRLSVTISAADRLLETPREELARTIWREVAAASGLPADLPPWQIVRERRATFAAAPAQNARRPRAETAWANLTLAGDWTATGLPATIEGAIRSGNRAADSVMQKM